MYTASWEPHGRALLDYHRGDRDAVLVVCSSLGDRDPLPVRTWFRERGEFFAMDRAALELARGRVLDVGAGVGVHALELQARGHDVVAIDHAPQAVEIMRARGVRDARVADVAEIDAGLFDTVMVLANGAGLAETLAGLAPLLRSLARHLAPGGALLIDSTDLRPQFAARADGAYVGDLEFWLEYRGERAPSFRQLYVDPETFALHAERAGLAFEVAGVFEGGGYLARLTER